MGTFKEKENHFWYRFLIYALILFCIALITVPVYAVDYSGSLTQAETLTVETHTVPHAANPLNQLIYQMYTNHIENYQCLTYMSVSGPFGEYTWNYSYQGGSLPVSFYIGTFKIGEGNFAFNNNSGTGNVVIVVQPLWWNVTYRTGSATITIDSTDPEWAIEKLYGLRAFNAGSALDELSFFAPNNAQLAIGDYVVYNKFTFRNDWDMTKSGVITTVNVDKFGMYNSRIGIYSNDNTLISQETSQNHNDYTAYILTAPIKIAALDILNHWHNTSYYYQNQYQVYIDPSPASTSSPSDGTISSMTSDLSEIYGVYWKVDDLSFYEPGSNYKTLNYVKIGTHWYGWDAAAGNFTNDKGTAMPNPVFLNFTSSGIKTILTYIFSPAGGVAIYTPITVSGVPSGSLTVSATDWSTLSLINNAEIDMLDQNHVIWYNNTAPTGKWTNPFPIGTHVQVEGKATGYKPSNAWTMVIDGDNSFILKMYPIGYNVTADITKTTLYVNVYDGKYPISSKVPLSGFTLWVRNDLGNIATYSGYEGSVKLTLNNQTTYFVSAGKTGYTTAGQYVNTTVAEQYLDLYPMPVVVTGTPTITPTTTVTPTPTISGYIPATGNFTGFWAPFQNALIASGTDPTAVGPLMALGLAFAGLILGFMVGSIPGGELGAIIGIAYSVSAGFFPLAIAIVVSVGLIAYTSLRFWGAAH